MKKKVRVFMFIPVLVLSTVLSLSCSKGEKNPGAADIEPLLILDVKVASVQKGATVSWQTNRPATSQARYGLSEQNGFLTREESKLVTNHSVNLEGLREDSPYYIWARSKDAFGNMATSEAVPFKAQSQNKGSISGRVEPALSGAKVAARQNEIDKGSAVIDLCTGEYKINDLPAGRYDLLITADGYFDKSITGIEIKGREELSGHNITLKEIARGSVSGKTSPQFVCSVVEVFDFCNKKISRSITDPNDNYQIDNLLPGVYKLKFEGGGRYTSVVLDNFVIKAGEEIRYDVTLKETSAFVEGRTFPVNPEVRVTAMQEGVEVSSATTVPGSVLGYGYYTLILEEGNYDLVIEADGYQTITKENLVVKAKQDIEGLDFTLTPLGMGSIKGRVKPIDSKAGVVVYRQQESVEIDSNGYYKIENLLPGTYGLVIYAEGYLSAMIKQIKVGAKETMAEEVTLFSQAVAAEEIKEILSRYEESYEKKDADLLLTCFSEEKIRFYEIGKELKRELLLKETFEAYESIEIECTNLEIGFLYDIQANVQWEGIFKGVRQADGQEVQIQQKTGFIFLREDGKWWMNNVPMGTIWGFVAPGSDN